MKIEPLCAQLMCAISVRNLCVQLIFEWPEMAKNEILDFSDPTCVSLGYFIHILYVNVVILLK